MVGAGGVSQVMHGKREHSIMEEERHNQEEERKKHKKQTKIRS